VVVCSCRWQHLLVHGKLHWSVPFAQTTCGFAALLAACVWRLRERPPPPPEERSRGAVGALLSIVKRTHENKDAHEAVEAEAATVTPRVEMVALMHKVATR
jgi:hypothetical protein